MNAVVVKIEARAGGNAWDAADDLTVARDGSIYVFGSARSADFPTTPDAVQRRFGGPDRDVFLVWPSAKMAPSSLEA